MLILLLQSIMAGICIAMGCVLSVRIDNVALAAMLFAIGLSTIRLYGGALYTGKTQKLIDKNQPLSWYRLLWVLAGNILGTTIVALLSYTLQDSSVTSVMAELARTKQTIPYINLAFGSIMCGALMTIATAPKTPYWLTIFCVMAFILAGFSHSIADSFYYGGIASILIPSWWISVVGNLIGGIGMAALLNIEQAP